MDRHGVFPRGRRMWVAVSPVGKAAGQEVGMAGRYMRPAMIGATFFMGLAGAGTALGLTLPSGMKALDRVEKGEWEVRMRGSRSADAPARRLCLGDPAQLFQTRRPDAQCESFVITDTPERAAISYQCRGNGAGRTDLRVETPRLVQISAQGIMDGAPFSELLEARHVGPCR